MGRRPVALAVFAVALAGGPAGAAPPPGVIAAPARVDKARADVAAELSRLDGHRVSLEASGADYRIVDVAGEGAPLVGVVERRGAALWLRPVRGPARRLAGPLAVPRIAGPGYKVWVVGRAGADGSLVARRLGVLAPPRPR
jgi:hypothetical protein